MEVYTQITIKIIQEQERIIGPVAIEQARLVPGLSVNWAKQEIKFSGDQADIIDDLVRQYEHLFGTLSVEVCRDATATLVAQLSPDKRPKTLKA